MNIKCFIHWKSVANSNHKIEPINILLQWMWRNGRQGKLYWKSKNHDKYFIDIKHFSYNEKCPKTDCSWTAYEFAWSLYVMAVCLVPCDIRLYMRLLCSVYALCTTNTIELENLNALPNIDCYPRWKFRHPNTCVIRRKRHEHEW